jgi:hypothetical protein
LLRFKVLLGGFRNRVRAAPRALLFLTAYCFEVLHH